MAYGLQEIASDILMEQTPKKLLQVRGKVYELLVNVVPPELIIRQLATELMKKLDDEVKHEVCPNRSWRYVSGKIKSAFAGADSIVCGLQVVKWAAFYEHRLQHGSKAVFHIEAFVAKVMAVYKAWAVSAFA